MTIFLWVNRKYLLSLFLSASPTKPEDLKNVRLEKVIQRAHKEKNKEYIRTPQRQIILIVAQSRGAAYAEKEIISQYIKCIVHRDLVITKMASKHTS